jgi:hypothetical protein
VRDTRKAVILAKAGIQYAAPLGFIAGVPGILDHPLEPVIGRTAPSRWRKPTDEKNKKAGAIISHRLLLLRIP